MLKKKKLRSTQYYRMHSAPGKALDNFNKKTKNHIFKKIINKLQFGLLPTVFPFFRIHVIQCGNILSKNKTPVLLGIVAVRAIISIPGTVTIANIRKKDSGAIIGRAVPKHIGSENGINIWSANIWIDSGIIEKKEGIKLALEFRHHEKLVSEKELTVDVIRENDLPAYFIEDFKRSDSYTPSNDNPSENPVTTVSSRPAMIRNPGTGIFSTPIKSIILLRIDQLGDVMSSLPSVLYIKRMFPDAHITTLTQSNVIPIIEASGIADETLPISLNFHAESESRFITDDEKEKIKEIFSDRHYDLAIDLSPVDDSRPLLQLFSAHYRVGFKPEKFRFLDFGITVDSHDKLNSLSIISHASHIAMLINALAQAISPKQEIVPRLPVKDHDENSIFYKYRITKNKYMVIHTGARHAMNKWKTENFINLAEKIHSNTGMRIVIFFDDESEIKKLGNVDHLPFVMLSNLTITQFDAIVSNSLLMISNDTGPKHLAAVRGIETISIHLARLNWQEWGQNQRGVIVTKPVPCAGCIINNDLDSCDADTICIKSITVDDVYRAFLQCFERVSAHLSNGRENLS
ncbi:glycosyltransferase family 9 protein [Komagataeibacter swingsii]|nr:glycosyltransferase family 9 protein [Komagataeibacter swingsii]GBQ56486.1 hypothetical protein AA16373_0740 [Komagataeibacter swingsii DSM 16373]